MLDVLLSNRAGQGHRKVEHTHGDKNLANVDLISQPGTLGTPPVLCVLWTANRWSEDKEMPIQAPTNNDIANLLQEIADLLEQQDDNPYRVQAFRNGATSVRATQTPLRELVAKQGGEVLKQIEGVGQGLATTIFEFIRTGRSSYLQQLRVRQPPEDLFQRIPGIGEKLAHKLAHRLEVSSLEALERAAYEGRVEQVEGFGPRRVAAVRHSLAAMLSHSARRRLQPHQGVSKNKIQPDVVLLLEMDAEYRQQAEADELPKLSPRHFNPKNEAWLPILRTERAGWSMTVLFSNTARAHELGKTRDWVVIYYQEDGPEDQCTVVTEIRGPFKGKRVVRGRENECTDFHRMNKQPFISSP